MFCIFLKINKSAATVVGRSRCCLLYRLKSLEHGNKWTFGASDVRSMDARGSLCLKDWRAICRLARSPSPIYVEERHQWCGRSHAQLPQSGATQSFPLPLCPYGAWRMTIGYHITTDVYRMSDSYADSAVLWSLTPDDYDSRVPPFRCLRFDVHSDI